MREVRTKDENPLIELGESWDDAAVRALASHQCGPSSIPRLGVISGLRLLLVLVLPCSERFLSGYSGFPPSSETNIFKFQFDLDCLQAVYHEPLAREIVQVLPVLLTTTLLYFTLNSWE